MANMGRRRLDGYGRPLPHLVDAPPRDSQNRQQQHLIERLLAEEYAALLVHGMYAEVTLTFEVSNGMIGTDVYVVRCQQHRMGEESSS
jgi:hypothetical protein